MYNQFCKNLKHFSGIMGNNDGRKNIRGINAEVLLSLTDIETYREYKNSRKEEYTRISNLIYDISQYSDKYPALKRLVWELWAYGFDIEQAKEQTSRNYEIEEVAKLADLMLSTHYFE